MSLPPYAEFLGVTIDRSTDGQPPVLVMPFSDDVLGRPGFLHGGAIGGLLEMAAIVALWDALDDEDARGKPIGVTVDYMRGGRQLPTRAQGKVTRLGNRIANVEAVAWQDDPAKPIASARMNYLLKR